MKQKPRGYWSDLNNILAEAKRVMGEHNYDTFPTARQLKNLGLSGLSNAITKYYPGKLPALRCDLGGVNDRKPPGYWQNSENIVSATKELVEKHGYDCLPTQEKLRALGHSDLAAAISVNYSGGFHALRNALGGVNDRKPKGYWKEPDNIIAEAKQVMEQHGYEFLPPYDTICDLGLASLSVAISGNYPGGFHSLRRDLQEQSTPGLSHVQSLSQQSPELAKIIAELYLPTKLSIPSVGEAITPIDLPAVGSWYETVVGKQGVSEEVVVRLDEALYSLLQNEYQIRYNENPTQTLEELTQLQHEQPALNNITTKLVNYFTSVDEFDIPGFE